MKNEKRYVTQVIDRIYSEAYEPDEHQFIAYVLGKLRDEQLKAKMELLELENFLFTERIEIAKNYIQRGNVKTVQQYFKMLNEETTQFKKQSSKNQNANDINKSFNVKTSESIYFTKHDNFDVIKIKQYLSNNAKSTSSSNKKRQTIRTKKAKTGKTFEEIFSQLV